MAEAWVCPNCGMSNAPWVSQCCRAQTYTTDKIEISPWHVQQIKIYPTPQELRDCTANKPLLMVIPPEGTTITCPIHPQGHFIQGTAIYLSDS